MSRVVCRSLATADYAAVRQIIAGAFGDHVGDNPEAVEHLAQEPWYDPDHLLVAELDGEVVSHLGVRDSGLWLGGRLVPAGLVGTVCTRDGWRGRGIGSQLLRYAFDRMAAGGLALSVLHTSEQRYAFYERLGYRRAVIEQPRLMLNLAAARGRSPIAVRLAGSGDAAALDELYGATYGRATGAWGRSSAFWERRLAGVPKLWSRVLRFAVAGAGAPRAYAAYEEVEGAGTVHELGCAPGAEAEAVDLLEHLLTQWRERGVLVADLAVSSSHPLRSRVEHLVDVDRTGLDVVFIRVQNEDRFRRAVTPLLRERAAGAGLELSVQDREAGVALKVPGEPAGLLALELGEVAALVYNGRAAPSQGDLAARLTASPWAGTLFPSTGAARCGLDGY